MAGSVIYRSVVLKVERGRRFIKEETENQLTEWKEVGERGLLLYLYSKVFPGMVYFYNVTYRLYKHVVSKRVSSWRM